MVTPPLSSISGNFSRAGASKKQIDSLKGVSLLMKKHLLPLLLCLSLLAGCAAAGAAAQSVPKAAGDVSIPVLDADSHLDTSYTPSQRSCCANPGPRGRIRSSRRCR